MSPELAVVIPVYNEAASISGVLEEWRLALAALGIDYRFLPVDDGSTDATADVLAELAERCPGRIRVLSQPNAGHGAACRAGYEQAARSGVAWILQIDADGQCDPCHFAAFWGLRGAHDCIFGLRTARADGLARRLVSAFCSAAASAMAGVNLGDANVPYRLMRRESLVRALASVAPGFALQNVALTAALLRGPGTRAAWAPIRFRRRAGGESSLNWTRIARLGLGMIRQWKELSR